MGTSSSVVTRPTAFARLAGFQAVLVLAIAMTTVVVIAQEQHAAIEGRVRDAQEAAVPGVVVLASNGGGVSVEAVSDGAGVYRFASLLPGTYSLSAQLTGFAPVQISNLSLTLGRQLTVDIILVPAGLTEVVNVTAPSPLLAVTQSARATSLRGDDIEKMPRGRDFTSLAVDAPGTGNEAKVGGITIDGSTGAENRVIVDGMETTDTWLGTPGQSLVTDFVEEFQVKSSGYSAEYGGSTGGVLNVLTRSGSNQWWREVLLYWSDDVLDSAPRQVLRLVPVDTTRAEYVTYDEDDYRQLEPGFTIAGPILRDRLWVFGGYVPSHRHITRSVVFRANGSSGTYHQQLARHNVTANANAQFGSRWRTRGSFNTGSQRQDGVLPALDGSSNPNANFAIDDVVANYSTSFGLDFMPSQRTYFGARGGYFYRNLYNEGVYRGDRLVFQTPSVNMPGVPVPFQRAAGYTNAPSNFGRDRSKGPRLTAQFDGTLFGALAGRHELKAGVQVDHIGLDALSGATGNGILVFWDRAFMGTRGPLGYYQVTSNDRLPNLGFITEGKAAVTNFGLFLQDAWTINGRLTIQAGLRTDNEHVPSLSPDPRIPDTAIHFGFLDKIAPRLGASWDVTGNGRTKLYGSWGVFYDITKLQISFGFGGVSSASFYYTLDSGDLSAIVDNPDCPPACPGTFISRSMVGAPLNDPNDNRIDPDLRQTRLQEAVAGIERELTPTLSAGVRYVHKHVDRAVEDVGTRDPLQNGTTYRIANPGLGLASTFSPERSSEVLAYPSARRQYDAVELSIDRRQNRGWSARGSYTWSRLWGNYSGLAQSDENGRVAPNAGRVFDIPMMAFDESGQAVYGVLASDRPHQLKLSLVFDFRSGTSLGARWFGASGVPRTREAAFVPGMAAPVMYRGRNSDERLPPLNQLDLHLQHQWRLGGALRLTVSLNALNLLNRATAINYFPSELAVGQAITIDESRFYDGIDTQQLVRDPRLMMDSEFQTPRSLRIGFKLGF
jgi:hypothetical protein